MPFNGAGTFTRLYSWVTDKANGVKIIAQRVDDEMNGMATGLSNAITRDGQSTVTAAIPFNGQRITALGDATADGDAVSRGLADGRYRSFAADKLVLDGANLRLLPFRGNYMPIDGVVRSIPSGGVSLPATGLTAGTRYYVYAVGTGPAVSSLEASVTGYSVNAATGQATKAGDASRALVGQVYVDTGPAFTLIRSRNNDPGCTRWFLSSSNVNGSTTLAWLFTGIEVTVLMWADEALDLSFTSSGLATAAAPNNYNTAFGIDGAIYSPFCVVSGSSSRYETVAITAVVNGFGEGLHRVQIFGQNASNTGNSALTYVANTAFLSVRSRRVV